MAKPSVARALVVLVAMLVASPSSAAPVEEVAQLARHPTDPQRMALRWQFAGDGLFYTDDGGASWRMLCGAATKAPDLGRAPSKLGRMAIASDDSLLLGVFGGLLRDDGRGCSWEADAPLLDQWVTDVVPHPTDPDVTFAVTSLGGGVDNGVYRRDGSGTWEAIGTHEPILLGGLLVADLGDGALRFYVLSVQGVWCGDSTCPDSQACCRAEAFDGGISHDHSHAPSEHDAGVATTCAPSDGMCEFGVENSKPRFVVRVSDDMGETWTDHEFGATEAFSLALAAVDPTDPDRLVLARLNTMPGQPPAPGAGDDEVLVSVDRGATFGPYASMPLFGGATFAPDGRLWIGGRNNSFSPDTTSALYYAERLDPAQSPELLTEALQVRCLQYFPDSDNLFVCQRFDAGFAQTDGTGYEHVFAFNEVEHLVACDDSGIPPLCVSPLQEFCSCAHFAGAPVCASDEVAMQRVRDGLPATAPDCVGTDADLDAGPSDDDAGRDADVADADVRDAGGGASSKSDGGCGCRLAGTSDTSDTSSGMPVLLPVALLLGLRRAKRVSRARGSRASRRAG